MALITQILSYYRGIANYLLPNSFTDWCFLPDAYGRSATVEVELDTLRSRKSWLSLDGATRVLGKNK